MGKAIDLTGQVFGKLTVIGLNEEESDKLRPNGKQRMSKIRFFDCQCECGNRKTVRAKDLRDGKIVSCGCYNREKTSKMCLKDLTGMKFSRLTVIERQGSNKHKNPLWICQCECGNITKPIRSNDLKNGKVTSCGCYNTELKMTRVGKNCPAWRGGITPITKHLRQLMIIEQWRKDTYERENYKCQLTGKEVHGGNSDVHHLKGFNVIVKDAHDLYSIEIKPQVKNYTEDELKKIEDYVTSCHTDTTNSVLLCKEVHELFHSLYGKGDNTPQQYEEFKQRYLNGEFENSDSNNNKVA